MWVQDRIDDGRRVAERTLHDGRKVAERALGDGQKVAERSWFDGRKAAGQAYDDGREMAGRAYADGRREAERRLEQASREARHRLEEGRRLVAGRLRDGGKSIGESRKAIRDRFGDRAPAVEAGVVAGAIIWPALLFAAGASVAYFCWNQYKRGRVERHERSLDEPGGEGPHIAAPEMVLAHNDAPKPQGREAVDPSDADLAEPAEELFLHGPLDDAPPKGESLNAVKAKGSQAQAGKPGDEAQALAAAAGAARASRPTGLDESLAVQGAASASKRKSPNGATPSAAKPARKGPTVM